MLRVGIQSIFLIIFPNKLQGTTVSSVMLGVDPAFEAFFGNVAF
jgi:hypothetical protein